MFDRSVRKLTTSGRFRQQFVGNVRFLRRFAILAALILHANATQADAGGNWHPIDDITNTAERYLIDKTGDRAGQTSVRAGALDPRHRLARCSEALEAFLRRGAKIAARTIVGVRCSGARPWKVYLPVDLIVTAAVATSARSLPGGHVITAGDLRLDKRDVSRLRTGYYEEPQALVGQQLKQALVAGRILTPSMLRVQHLVERGQTVTLTSAGGGISITMLGKALMHGALNQRIRVENSNSGRIVEGVVRSSEQVEILLPEGPDFFHAKPKVSP